jgi:hypothetical protein
MFTLQKCHCRSNDRRIQIVVALLLSLAGEEATESFTASSYVPKALCRSPLAHSMWRSLLIMIRRHGVVVVTMMIESSDEHMKNAPRSSVLGRQSKLAKWFLRSSKRSAMRLTYCRPQTLVYCL